MRGQNPSALYTRTLWRWSAKSCNLARSFCFPTVQQTSETILLARALSHAAWQSFCLSAKAPVPLQQGKSKIGRTKARLTLRKSVWSAQFAQSSAFIQSDLLEWGLKGSDRRCLEDVLEKMQLLGAFPVERNSSIRNAFASSIKWLNWRLLLLLDFSDSNLRAPVLGQQIAIQLVRRDCGRYVFLVELKLAETSAWHMIFGSRDFNVLKSMVGRAILCQPVAYGHKIWWPNRLQDCSCDVSSSASLASSALILLAIFWCPMEGRWV